MNKDILRMYEWQFCNKTGAALYIKAIRNGIIPIYTSIQIYRYVKLA